MDLGAARQLAEELLAQHGLLGWRVQFDRAKTRAGVCRFRDSVIGLSVPLTSLHSGAEVRDTLLHEIAHALVGPTHRHDAVWRAKAAELGCTPRACMPTTSARIPAPWVGTCPAGHSIQRHRRPERPASCRHCTPTFNGDHLFRWRFRGHEVPMHPNYVAELRALGAGVDSSPAGSEGEPAAPGVDVRIRTSGKYSGAVGTVVKRGRTRYHVRLSSGVVTVPFALTEPVATPRERAPAAGRREGVRG